MNKTITNPSIYGDLRFDARMITTLIKSANRLRLVGGYTVS